MVQVLKLAELHKLRAEVTVCVAGQQPVIHKDKTFFSIMLYIVVPQQAMDLVYYACGHQRSAISLFSAAYITLSIANYHCSHCNYAIHVDGMLVNVEFSE